MPTSLVGLEQTWDTNDPSSASLKKNQEHEFAFNLLLFKFMKYFRCNLYAGLHTE